MPAADPIPALSREDLAAIEAFVERAWQAVPLPIRRDLLAEHEAVRTILGHGLERAGGWRTMSIEALDLSVRGGKSLRDARRWRTVGELDRVADLELLRLPNFGRKCLVELRQAIAAAKAAHPDLPEQDQT